LTITVKDFRFGSLLLIIIYKIQLKNTHHFSIIINYNDIRCYLKVDFRISKKKNTISLPPPVGTISGFAVMTFLQVKSGINI